MILRRQSDQSPSQHYQVCCVVNVHANDLAGVQQCDLLAAHAQVVAVLAHELGHWKLGHTICLLVSQQAIMLAQFVLFAVFRSSDHLLEEFGFTGDTKPVIVSLTLFMMMIGPIDKLISWLFNLLSRRYVLRVCQSGLLCVCGSG